MSPYRHRRFTLAAALALVVGAACSTRSSAAPRIETASADAASDSVFVTRLRAHLQAATAAEQFSGAVLVVRDGRTLFEAGYGLADRERGIPNTPQTKFRIGSMNKMLTAVAALQFVQAGMLRLDAPLGTYLPEYPNEGVKSKVTTHHLLTHTGGTGNIFGPAFMENRLALREVSDYVRLYGTRDLEFTPGEKYAYSNYGFVLLGALIERLSGKSYHDHIAARVLTPAGMTGTGTLPEDSLVPGRSAGYMREGGPTGPLVSNAPTLPYRGTAAGGGYSTVGDLARFAAAVRDGRLLDRTHTELLYTGKVQAGSFQYAYGFADRVIGGRRFVGHGGGAPGMNGDLVFEPNGGYVIVVLSNLDPPAAQTMLNYIVYNLPGIALPVAILDRYVGEYRSAAGTVYMFRRDGTTLFVTPGANPESHLTARSETRLQDSRGPIFEFQLDANGKVTGAILEQQGPQGPQRTQLTRQ